jgi:hypothetical protein
VQDVIGSVDGEAAVVPLDDALDFRVVADVEPVNPLEVVEIADHLVRVREILLGVTGKFQPGIVVE